MWLAPRSAVAVLPLSLPVVLMALLVAPVLGLADAVLCSLVALLLGIVVIMCSSLWALRQLSPWLVALMGVSLAVLVAQ